MTNEATETPAADNDDQTPGEQTHIVPTLLASVRRPLSSPCSSYLLSRRAGLSPSPTALFSFISSLATVAVE